MPSIACNIEAIIRNNMSSRQKIKQRFVDFIQKLANENSTPTSIALGFTLGTFIAILPTPGFGAFLAISFTLIFKNINRLAVIVSVTIWNPLLLVPLYYLCYLLGSLLLAKPIDLHEELSLYELLSQYTTAFLVGNIILASIIALISYVGVYHLMTEYTRHQRLRKLMSLYRTKQSKPV